MPPLATFPLLARPSQIYKHTNADSLLARASFGPTNGVHFKVRDLRFATVQFLEAREMRQRREIAYPGGGAVDALKLEQLGQGGEICPSHLAAVQGLQAGELGQWREIYDLLSTAPKMLKFA